MPSPNQPDTCPTLTMLNGTLGRDAQGRKLWPAHVYIDGVCRYCKTGVKS